MAPARASTCRSAHLVRISAFWLGLTSIDAVVNATVQARLEFDNIVTPGSEGMALAFIAVVTFAFSVAVQPTVGSISDYTTSRWGRRKPYIVVGALLDVVFLIGIATANSLLAITAFVTLLQFSTNTARGAFQGYVPDLVPDRQVGLASAMVGLMQVFGNVLGFALAAIATEPGEMSASPCFAIAVVEVVTMLSVVLRVPKGPPAKPREGRSWVQIAAETWGTDILREKTTCGCSRRACSSSMGGASLVNFVIWSTCAAAHGRRRGRSDTDGPAVMLAAATSRRWSRSCPGIAPVGSDRAQAGHLAAAPRWGIAGLATTALAPNIHGGDRSVPRSSGRRRGRSCRSTGR